MTITLNGQPRPVAPQTTIAQLLDQLELRGNQVAVEVNQELIPRARHDEFVLQPGDELELVTLVGGG